MNHTYQPYIIQYVTRSDRFEVNTLGEAN